MGAFLSAEPMNAETLANKFHGEEMEMERIKAKVRESVECVERRIRFKQTLTADCGVNLRDFNTAQRKLIVSELERLGYQVKDYDDICSVRIGDAIIEKNKNNFVL